MGSSGFRLASLPRTTVEFLKFRSTLCISETMLPQILAKAVTSLSNNNDNAMVCPDVNFKENTRGIRAHVRQNGPIQRISTSACNLIELQNETNVIILFNTLVYHPDDVHNIMSYLSHKKTMFFVMTDTRPICFDRVTPFDFSRKAVYTHNPASVCYYSLFHLNTSGIDGLLVNLFRILRIGQQTFAQVTYIQTPQLRQSYFLCLNNLLFFYYFLRGQVPVRLKLREGYRIPYSAYRFQSLCRTNLFTSTYCYRQLSSTAERTNDNDEDENLVILLLLLKMANLAVSCLLLLNGPFTGIAFALARDDGSQSWH